ncbi:MAG: ATP-binding protein [archaeon]|nr:ATP-binding protein [archaeon]
MIIRASFENIYSFNEETSISFVAGKSDNLEELVVRAQKRDEISLLKSGIIYGANASGKSNVIKAIHLLKEIACGKWPANLIEPFKLKEPDNEPSRIEIEFKSGAKYFAYGMKFNIQGVVEEWLYEVKARSQKKVFERTVKPGENSITLGEKKLNTETAKFIEFLAKATPSKKSFLSEYNSRNGEGIDSIKDAYSWFDETLRIIFPESRFQGLSFKIEEDKNFEKSFNSLLKYFNTGIDRIKRIPINKEELKLSSDIVAEIQSELKPDSKNIVFSGNGEDLYFFEMAEDGSVKISMQKTVHKGSDNKEYTFNMHEESDGSIRLFDLIPMLIMLKLGNYVFLVDEIDRSLHPRLSYQIFDFFLQRLARDSECQLIATTHECNLLDTKIFRRDEIWFVEKEKNGASHATSLVEFDFKEDIKKGYLQGRYGAIPFFTSPVNLKL